MKLVTYFATNLANYFYYLGTGYATELQLSLNLSCNCWSLPLWHVYDYEQLCY